MRNLVHAILLRIISAKRSPEIAVDRAKISCRSAKLLGVCFVGPLSPDVDAACTEICLTRVARQEPEQLFRHPAKRNTLRGDDRESLAKIESCLEAEM